MCRKPRALHKSSALPPTISSSAASIAALNSTAPALQVGSVWLGESWSLSMSGPAESLSIPNNSHTVQYSSVKKHRISSFISTPSAHHTHTSICSPAFEPPRHRLAASRARCIALLHCSTCKFEQGKETWRLVNQQGWQLSCSAAQHSGSATRCTCWTVDTCSSDVPMHARLHR